MIFTHTVHVAKRDDEHVNILGLTFVGLVFVKIVEQISLLNFHANISSTYSNSPFMTLMILLS